ncbi:MAG: hypothetical protein AAF202_10455, partial [Pseudomonadota bacterium]
MSKMDRAQLSGETRSMQPILENVYSQLKELSAQADRAWYISLIYERRATASARANNNKKTSLDEGLNEGMVLRVYDGVTMFEEACDQLDEQFLGEKAHGLAARVLSNTVETEQLRSYRSPSWSERLDADLDSEITSQIPSDVEASTWVVFGTKWNEGYWG